MKGQYSVAIFLVILMAGLSASSSILSLPDVENEYIPNTYSSNSRFPPRIKPIIHSTPQTIAFGSITPTLQATLQNLQDTLINQTNTNDISTTAEPSDTENASNEPESSPLQTNYSAHT